MIQPESRYSHLWSATTPVVADSFPIEKLEVLVDKRASWYYYIKK